MDFQTPIGRFINLVVANIPYGDKTMHFLLMAVFTFLLNGALNNKQLRWAGQQWPAGSLIVALLITLEECSQVFIPSRNFEMMDLVCKHAGIYAGRLLLLFLLPGLGHQTTGKANERTTTISIQAIFNKTR